MSIFKYEQPQRTIESPRSMQEDAQGRFAAKVNTGLALLTAGTLVGAGLWYSKKLDDQLLTGEAREGNASGLISNVLNSKQSLAGKDALVKMGFSQFKVEILDQGELQRSPEGPWTIEFGVKATEVIGGGLSHKSTTYTATASSVSQPNWGYIKTEVYKAGMSPAEATGLFVLAVEKLTEQPAK